MDVSGWCITNLVQGSIQSIFSIIRGGNCSVVVTIGFGLFASSMLRKLKYEFLSQVATKEGIT